MLSIYYSLLLLHGNIQQPIALENILAKDKKTNPPKTTVATAVAAAKAPATRIKITGTDDERTEKVASVIAAGADISQIEVDKFTRLPENFTLTPAPTGTLSQADVEKILGDSDNNHATDPIPPGTEGAFDPLAPEPFVPNPIASVPSGQTPILEHKPYSSGNWNANFSSTLVERSNELANKIWPSQQSYIEARHGIAKSISHQQISETMEANRNFFDRWPLIAEVRRVVGIDRVMSGRPVNDPSYPYAFAQRAQEVLTKLRRLEKKHAEEDIFDDVAREKIIETVLVPTTSFGVNSQYHGYQYLDLRFPHQKAVVNEVLTKEEVSIIEALINYIPRLRVLLTNYDQHVGSYTKDDVLYPLTGKRDEQRLYDLQEDRKLLLAVKKVRHFLDQAMPGNIAQDFLPELRYPRKSDEAYLNLQKASKELREASLGYIQETSPLSKMLERIIDLATALEGYLLGMVDEIGAVFAYLDRVGVTYQQFVDESASVIRGSDYPW